MRFVIKSVLKSNTFYKCDDVVYYQGWSKSHYRGEQLMTRDLDQAYKFRYYRDAEKVMNRSDMPSMSIVQVEEKKEAVDEE